MSRKIYTLLIAISLLGEGLAQAQYSRLSLSDALSIAFENSPAVRATEYAEKAAHRERQAAIGLFMPQLSLKGGYAHLNRDVKIDLTPVLAHSLPLLGEGLSALGLDLSYTVQQRNTAFLGGDVVLPLFAGGKVWVANRVAKIEEKRTSQQSARVRGDVAMEVIERYFGVVLAERVVVVCEEVLSVVEAHLKDVILLEKSGMAVESERLYAEYRMAEAERDLQRAKLRLETLRKALQISLGMESAVEPSTHLFIVEQIEPLEYFTSQAVMRNHQLAEVGSMRELAQANLRLRKAELMPEVVAMGGVTLCNYQLSSLVPRMAVGVGLNFRIFDGLRSEYRTASARLQLRRAEALEQKAKQDVVLLVEDSYNRLQSILTTAFAVERSERFAREYLRSKQLAYREGMATTTDVVDAALNLSRAQLERAQMAFEFDVALARLLEVSGVGNLFVKYLNGATTKLIY